MKKTYVRPSMVCEVFAADEYVAACGDSGTTYKFECNAPGGPLYYYPKFDGSLDGVQTGNGRKDFLGLFYSPCNKEHETDASGEFKDGFVDYNLNTRHDAGEGVIVYLEKRGNVIVNAHATQNLNFDSWETAKS